MNLNLTHCYFPFKETPSSSRIELLWFNFISAGVDRAAGGRALQQVAEKGRQGQARAYNKNWP